MLGTVKEKSVQDACRQKRLFLARIKNVKSIIIYHVSKLWEFITSVSNTFTKADMTSTATNILTNEMKLMPHLILLKKSVDFAKVAFMMKKSNKLWESSLVLMKLYKVNNIMFIPTVRYGHLKFSSQVTRSWVLVRS